MRWRTVTLGAAAAAAILGSGPMMSRPAHAAFCIYTAQDARGKTIASGNASGITMKGACRRAKRRCNRALKGRPFRGCHRTGQAR